MKVSVITVTVDSDEALARTLDSVAAQRFSGVESIVVDGRPCARSADFKARYGCSTFYETAPRGIYPAINYGIERCTGDIIGLLHGNDTFASPDVLAAIHRAFEDDDALDFVYGDIRYVHPVTRRPGRIYSAARFIPSDVLQGIAPPHPSLYMRRRVAEQLGPYCERLRISSDFEMFVRLFLKHNFKGRYMPMVVTEMATGGLSTSLYNRLFVNSAEKFKALRMNGFKVNPLRLLGKYIYVLKDLLR